MKKVLLFLSVTLLTTTSYSQVPIDTADLRAKINNWLVPNSTRAITATKVNQLFNGIASLMKAYAVDSAYRINDTLFLTRRNGFNTIKVTLDKDTNFANSDLVFNADRTHDGNHHGLYLDNFGNIEIKSNNVDGSLRAKITLDSAYGQLIMESAVNSFRADPDGYNHWYATQSDGRSSSITQYGASFSAFLSGAGSSQASWQRTAPYFMDQIVGPYVADSTSYTRREMFVDSTNDWVRLFSADNGLGSQVEYRRNEGSRKKDTTHNYIYQKHKITGALIKRTDFDQGLSSFTFNASGSANPNLLFYIKSLPISSDSTTYKPAGISSAGQLVRMNNWSGVGGISMGNAVSGGTSGSILYLNSSGNLAQDNPNFFWDQTNKRFGRRITTPTSSIHIHNNTTENNYLSFSTDGSIGGDPVNVKYTIKAIDGSFVGDPVQRAGIQFKSENSIGGDPISGLFSFDGIVGIGTTTPTAKLHLASSGSALAGSAPLKFTSGSLVAIPENGAMEYDGTSYYLTTGGTRYTVPLALPGTPTIEAVANAGSTFSTAHTFTTGTNVQTFTSTNATVYGYAFSNTGNGGALSAASTGTGPALTSANSSSGAGIQTSSVSGMGINAISTSGTAGRFKITPTSTNTTERVANFIRGISGGTAANNMGGSIGLQLTDDGGNDYAASQITWYQTNASSASRTTSLGLSTVNAGTNATKLLINGPGQIRFPLYNSTTFDNYDVTAPILVVDGSGNVGTRPASNWVQTSTVTVSGNAAETTLLGSGVGNLTIPAGKLIAGKTYRIHANGVLSTDGSNPAQHAFRIKLGSTTIATTADLFNGTGTTNRAFELDVTFTCRTSGSSGTIMAMGLIKDENDAINRCDNGNGVTSTIDTTVPQTVNFVVDMTNNSAGNSASIYVFTLEEVN